MIIEQTPPSRWQQTRILVLRWLISTLAIFAAVRLVPGITFVGPGWQLGLIAMIFGLDSTRVRPKESPASMRSNACGNRRSKRRSRW